jgi:hypothetical protein
VKLHCHWFRWAEFGPDGPLQGHRPACVSKTNGSGVPGVFRCQRGNHAPLQYHDMEGYRRYCMTVNNVFCQQLAGYLCRNRSSFGHDCPGRRSAILSGSLSMASSAPWSSFVTPSRKILVAASCLSFGSVGMFLDRLPLHPLPADRRDCGLLRQVSQALPAAHLLDRSCSSLLPFMAFSDQCGGKSKVPPLE